MLVAEWLFGYVAGKLSDRLFRAHQGDLLLRDLEAAIDQWREALPETAWLEDARALFPAVRTEHELSSRPSLRELRDAIAAASIPSKALWAAALLEQWQKVRTIPFAQPFFCIEQSEAVQYLDSLASRMVVICSQHERLFRPTVVAMLIDLQEQLGRLIADEDQSGKDELEKAANHAIQWSETMREILPRYRFHMDHGLPWPGEASDLTDREYAQYRLLKTIIQLTSPQSEQMISLMDKLRSRETLDGQWFGMREMLIDQISQWADQDQPDLHGPE